VNQRQNVLALRNIKIAFGITVSFPQPIPESANHSGADRSFRSSRSNAGVSGTGTRAAPARYRGHLPLDQFERGRFFTGAHIGQREEIDAQKPETNLSAGSQFLRYREEIRLSLAKPGQLAQFLNIFRAIGIHWIGAGLFRARDVRTGNDDTFDFRRGTRRLGTIALGARSCPETFLQ